MLLTKEVEITLNPRTIPHYEEMGYDIPRYKNKSYVWKVKKGTKITVKVKDLNKGNKVPVLIKCDYCGKEFKKEYNQYIRSKEQIIDKDSCIDCRKHKIKEVCQEKYGVGSIFQTDKLRKYNSESKKLDLEHVRKQFRKKNIEPIFKDEDYHDCNSHLEYICPKHPDVIQWTTVASLIHSNNNGCRLCYYDSRRGEYNHNWKGGRYLLNVYLRDSLTNWIKDSVKSCNYRCIVTGEPFDEVHHLYNFSDIVQESLDELGIDSKKQTLEYTLQELEIIKNKAIEIHYKYPLGVCLTKEIHTLYHSIYGRKNNTPQQFEQFKSQYLLGMYDDVSKNNHTSEVLNVV